MGARGKHHLPGPNLPQPLAGKLAPRRRSQVIGDALQHGEIVVIEISEYRGSRQKAHLFHGLEFSNGLGYPIHCGLIVDQRLAPEQMTAEFQLLVGQNDPRAGPPRR